MTLCIDIDGTWDQDADFFQLVANLAQFRNHTVLIVTGRDQPAEKLARLGIADRWPVIVSRSLLKEEAVRKAGYEDHLVWIDDMPGMIQRTKILGEPEDDGKL